jgi:hypothetical protein
MIIVKRVVREGGLTGHQPPDPLPQGRAEQILFIAA